MNLGLRPPRNCEWNKMRFIQCQNLKSTSLSVETSDPPAIPKDPATLPEARLQKAFKEKLASLGLKGKVRANQSGCLDQCEHGPTVVVYPDAVWYGHVTNADVDEIVNMHILGGKPVERLRLADSCLNTATCEHRKPKP